MSIKAHAGKQMYSHLPATERGVKKFRQQSFSRLRASNPALRGWVWFRRWQGAVRVVDCEYRRIKVV